MVIPVNAKKVSLVIVVKNHVVKKESMNVYVMKVTLEQIVP